MCRNPENKEEKNKIEKKGVWFGFGKVVTPSLQTPN